MATAGVVHSSRHLFTHLDIPECLGCLGCEFIPGFVMFIVNGCVHLNRLTDDGYICLSSFLD